MVPDVVDSAVFSSMDAELIGKVSSFDCDVGVVGKPVALKVASFFLFVVMIVRSNYVHFLTKPSQLL